MVWMGLVGCTHWNPKSHLGADGKPSGAREIELECDEDGSCSGERRDVLTWRGGDTIDYFRVRVPRSGCATALLVRLAWQPARGETRLTLAFGTKRDGYTHASKRRPHYAEAELLNREGGDLLIRVALPTRDTAATYRLRVDEKRPGFCAARELYSPRPDGLVPPRSMVGPVVAVTAAGSTRATRADDDRWWAQPSLVLDASDSHVVPGARAVLVDARGAPVQHGEVEIVDVWTVADGVRFASARILEGRRFLRRLELGWDLWHVALRG